MTIDLQKSDRYTADNEPSKGLVTKDAFQKYYYHAYYSFFKPSEPLRFHNTFEELPAGAKLHDEV